MKVLITDYVWPNIDIERRILATVGAEAVVSPTDSEADLARLAVDCDAIMACFAQVTPAVVRAATRCVHIARYGIGVDSIATDVATELGIVVTNVPAYCVDEVAEHALGLLLASARKIPRYDRAIRSGHWDIQAGKPLHRINGRTLGVVGFGKIGRALAQKASGLGLRILAYDPYLAAQSVKTPGVELVDLDRLLRESDLVSIHVPLTAETRAMIGEEELRKMKPSACLVNTSRGSVVDIPALAQALREGWIAAAGIDVLPEEPPPADSPLLGLENLTLTPHASFYSEESLVDLQTSTAEEVVRVLSGQRPLHLINPEALPKARAAHLRE
ncbi:MAG: C-terminal binding protein [Bacteroidetes bacterium]|nr:C-terminal binding protein [Bacteroidota bacterium]